MVAKKLTEEDCKKIIKLINEGHQIKDLAKRYNVHRSTIENRCKARYKSNKISVKLKNKVIKAIKEGYTHYTNNYGLLDLRKAVASKMKTVNHVNVDYTSVLMTAGASLAIDMAMRLFLEPAQKLLVTG